MLLMVLFNVLHTIFFFLSVDFFYNISTVCILIGKGNIATYYATEKNCTIGSVLPPNHPHNVQSRI